MIIIDPKDVAIVYVRNSYDGILLEGHAWYKDDYCYVTSMEDDKKLVYTLYKLEGQTLINELAIRKLFEDVVGYHCTRKGLDKEYNFQGGGLTSDYKLFWSKFKKLIPEVNVFTLEKIGTWEIEYRDDDD